MHNIIGDSIPARRTARVAHLYPISSSDFHFYIVAVVYKQILNQVLCQAAFKGVEGKFGGYMSLF
jgi:hypothetical protein